MPNSLLVAILCESGSVYGFILDMDDPNYITESKTYWGAVSFDKSVEEPF